MGMGDQTSYVLVFAIDHAETVLSHLASSLNSAELSIEDPSADQIATIAYGGNSYQLPIYAISKRVFSDEDETGFRPEKALNAKLRPKAKAIKFNSGVWCKPTSILDDDVSDRTASKGKKTFHLAYMEFELDMGAKYVRLKMNIWGDQYWGGLEKDPAFAKLVKPLKELCEIFVIEDDMGGGCLKPKMKAAIKEQFGEHYQDHDYFQGYGPDKYAKAILEYKPDDDDDDDD